MNLLSIARFVRWYFLPLVLLAACFRPCRADVKLPAMFGSHMVLQQGTPDRVWGWADAGEEVTVKIAEQTKTATAGDDGTWTVTLDPLATGGPHTLTISGKNTVTLDDVLIGEVWLCSGQSNMQWPLSLANDADLEIRAANYPQIRLITVPNVGTQEPKTDFQGQWQVCSPDTVPGFSAVGYLFGRQLQETLHVPIGLINDAWGGSSCEGWINRERLAADERFEPLMKRWEELEARYPQDKAEYQQKLAEWRVAAEKAKAEGKQPLQQPNNPDGHMKGNARPGNIYNGVLKPTIGYGIRGVIWYQGESNAGRAYQYRDLFPFMIQNWREEWGIGDFPFYFVQLADFQSEQHEPQESAWAELREAQTMTMDKLPATGQAVIIDAGEAKDIHPRNKQDVAKRLARWALARDYGVQVPFHSPQFKSMEKREGRLVLTFDHVGGGLKTFDVGAPRGFAVAAQPADGSPAKFVWAKAQIIGPDRIQVWSYEVDDPAAARYAWADNPVCNVYSQEGLPLTPFRTDDWKGITADND